MTRDGCRGRSDEGPRDEGRVRKSVEGRVTREEGVRVRSGWSNSELIKKRGNCSIW